MSIEKSIGKPGNFAKSPEGTNLPDPIDICPELLYLSNMNTKSPNETATPAQLTILALEFRETARQYQAAGNGVWYAHLIAEARRYARIATDMAARS